MLHLPTIFHHLPHLLSKENSLQPAVHVGQGRTGGKWELVLLLVLFLSAGACPCPFLRAWLRCGDEQDWRNGCMHHASFLGAAAHGVGKPCSLCEPGCLEDVCALEMFSVLLRCFLLLSISRALWALPIRWSDESTVQFMETLTCLRRQIPPGVGRWFPDNSCPCS